MESAQNTRCGVWRAATYQRKLGNHDSQYGQAIYHEICKIVVRVVRAHQETADFCVSTCNPQEVCPGTHSTTGTVKRNFFAGVY